MNLLKWERQNPCYGSLMNKLMDACATMWLIPWKKVAFKSDAEMLWQEWPGTGRGRGFICSFFLSNWKTALGSQTGILDLVSSDPCLHLPFNATCWALTTLQILSKAPEFQGWTIDRLGSLNNIPQPRLPLLLRIEWLMNLPLSNWTSCTIQDNYWDSLHSFNQHEPGTHNIGTKPVFSNVDKLGDC